MKHSEKSQWNEKWQAQLDKAIQELVEKAEELSKLEGEIAGILAFIELIASQITPEPPE
jgi:methyl-accepting chemotaxis protein